MNEPTPYRLPEREALYRAGDLNNAEWEARVDSGGTWLRPTRIPPNMLVVARRKPWVPSNPSESQS